MSDQSVTLSSSFEEVYEVQTKRIEQLERKLAEARRERERANAAVAQNALEQATWRKVCTMNCGPGIGDTRTAEERKANCEDCMVVQKEPPQGTEDASELRQRLMLIQYIAEGSTSANSLPNIARIARGEGDLPIPQRRDGKEPCGECHLKPGETCDICGAYASPAPPSGVRKGMLRVCQGMIDIVERVGCMNWRDQNGRRLKDTKQWVEFYVAITRAAEQVNAEQTHVRVPVERLARLIEWMENEQDNLTCGDLCDKSFEAQGCPSGTCALEDGKRELAWWNSLIHAATGKESE